MGHCLVRPNQTYQVHSNKNPDGKSWFEVGDVCMFSRLVVVALTLAVWLCGMMGYDGMAGILSKQRDSKLRSTEGK